VLAEERLCEMLFAVSTVAVSEKNGNVTHMFGGYVTLEADDGGEWFDF